MRVELTTHVEASIDDLWAVVSDIEGWPALLDSIDAVRITSEGALGEGGTARVKQPGMPEMTWTVTRWQPGKGFDWQTRTAGTTTVGTHQLESDGSGSRLTLGLHQYGALAPVFAVLGGRRTKRYVGMERDGLKAAAERR